MYTPTVVLYAQCISVFVVTSAQ